MADLASECVRGLPYLVQAQCWGEEFGAEDESVVRKWLDSQLEEVAATSASSVAAAFVGAASASVDVAAGSADAAAGAAAAAASSPGSVV